MTAAVTFGPVSALPDWAADDLGAALAAYLVTADLAHGAPLPKPGEGAGAFFARAFRTSQPAQSGLLTGYYEPELPGAARPDARFRYPLYAAPPDLPADGPWFDRTAIEAGDLLAGHELVWLDSALEAFLAQVQGSVRVRLADGRVLRFGYAAKNGHPYTSIGRELIRRGALHPDGASVAAIRDWAAAHPDDLTGLLRLNASFVFFRPLDLPSDQGPLGAMGRPVTAGRTIAVDPAHIPLGMPVWLEWQGQARLVVAQDTGSAIRGAGRADLFLGTGDAAGHLAGALKCPARLTPLMPVPQA